LTLGLVGLVTTYRLSFLDQLAHYAGSTRFISDKTKPT